MTENDSKILSVEHLSYQYPDGHEVLKEVSFDVSRGQRIGIIGANGAGKSTLLLLICGLLESGAGKITIDQLLVSAKHFQKTAVKLGVVFQNPDDQLFTSSVYDDVAFGPLHSGLEKTVIHERVMAALAATHTTHLIKRAPQKLSGGEKRSVAIATAIVQSPEILILDEPTSGLDPRARRELIQLLAAFEHAQVITSHDLDFIGATCDQVILLSKGRIAAIGPANQILADEPLLLANGL